MKKPLLISTLLIWSSLAFAQTNAPTDSSKSGDSDKLDIKVLEDKYWSAKDDDFSVVQNRAFPKEKRFFASAQYGLMINDSFTTGRMTSASLGYFFTERWGLELSHMTGSIEDNDTTKKIISLGGSPDYNKFVSATTLSALYVPFYAKMSFLDKKILYFDMGIGLGVGQTNYESQVAPNDGVSAIAGSATHYTVDITQQVFFNRNLALRLDIRNRWSNQDINVYDLRNTQTEADRALSPLNIQETTMLFGVTYFH